MAQIPALVSTKHYSCARSSFKSLIPTGLLTCARIPRALQGRGKSCCLQLIYTTLWRGKSDTGAAQQEKEEQPDPSSVFSFHIPISAVTGAACRKVCSSLPSGHCCILGVKMRRHFAFGDLLLSSCYICKAHH